MTSSPIQQPSGTLATMLKQSPKGPSLISDLRFSALVLCALCKQPQLRVHDSHSHVMSTRQHFSLDLDHLTFTLFPPLPHSHLCDVPQTLEWVT